MNKLLFKTLSAILAVLLFVSCSSSSSSQKEVRTFSDIGETGIVQYPMVAKLDIKTKKIEGNYISSNCAINMNDCKIEAYYNAIKNGDADVLINPMFYITTESGKTEVKVSGFPASYIEFREMTTKDKEMFLANDTYQWLPLKTIEKTKDSSTTKKSGYGPLFAVLGGTVLAVVIAAIAVGN